MMIWGASGVGKSAIVMQCIQRMKYHAIDFRANLHEPTDLLGFPYIKDQNSDNPRSAYAPPAWLPLEGHAKPNSVILGEEMPNATADMQSAFYQATYDYAVGGAKFADDVSVIMLGNRMQDHGGTYDMPEPLKQRCAHYELVTDITDFTRYAYSADILPSIIAFLQWQPQYLHNIDHDAYTSPTPRQWELLSVRLERPTPNRLLTVQSHVGIAAARAFCAFEKDIEKIPDMDQLILNPLLAPVPDGALLYAVCSNLVHRADRNNLKPIMAYLNRIEPDFQIVTVRNIAKTKPELCALPEFMTWIEDNANSGALL